MVRELLQWAQTNGSSGLIVFRVAKCKYWYPQGSMLGSFLFLVDISYLPSLYSLLYRVLLAYDTCLAFTDDNYSNLLLILNSELKNVYPLLIEK